MTATLTPAAATAQPADRGLTLGGVRLTGSRLALGLAVLAVLLVAPQPWHQLRLADPLVDLHVYAAAGHALAHGRGVYDFFIPQAHQNLPFTYPPTAAVFAFGLGWIPRPVLDVLWDLGQYVLLVPVVARSFRPLLTRLGPRRAGAALPLLWLGAAYLLPMRGVIEYGQVGLVLLAFVMLDVLTPEPLRRRPRGFLIALATAIKLTPGVFVVMYAAAGQWSRAARAALWTLAIIAATAVVIPHTSWRYWTDALFDNSRLGPNDSTSNQSLRGMLLHTALPAEGAVWALLVLLVGAVGFTRARRAFLAGDLPAAVAITGLLACLLSPVAWIHHFTVVILVIGVLLGDGLVKKRLWWSLAVVALFETAMPWWGFHKIRAHAHYLGLSVGTWHPVFWVMQNSFGLAAVALVCLLPVSGRRDAALDSASARVRRVHAEPNATA